MSGWEVVALTLFCAFVVAGVGVIVVLIVREGL